MNAYTQRGNVLFLILIAVALFAALSYAVTQSNRGSGDQPDKEKAELITSELLNYMSTIQTAITRMRISGVDPSDFCFISDGWNLIGAGHFILYDGSPGCSDDRNKLFHADGGGVSFQTPPSDVVDLLSEPYSFTNRGQVIGVGDSGNSSLIFFLRAHRDNALWARICDEVNEVAGIHYTSTYPPADNLNVNDWSFSESGVFADPPFVGAVLGDNNALYQGHDFGCYLEGHGGSQLVVYMVMIVR